MTCAFLRIAGLSILAVVLGLPAGLEAQIRLAPSNDHRVAIFHDGYQGEWQYRLPELVDSREGTFLTYIRTPMEWRTVEPGVIGYDWEPTEQYSAEAYEKTSRRRTMIQGMRVAPRMKAGKDRIELWLHLTNRSNQTFHNVYSEGGCLQHRTPRFIDETYERSFLVTASGLTPLTRTDRSKGIRAAYFFNPAWYDLPSFKAYEYFWGRSETRPEGPLVVSQAKDGPGAIGILWDQCLGVRQNSDSSHHCMHSSPYFGAIRPGQTVTRRGLILFGDDAEDVFRKSKRERLKPHRSPPER